MRTAIILSAAILANSLGSVCLSKGMKQFPAEEFLGGAGFLQAGWHVLSNPWIILGVLLLITFLAAYLTALSWADLSFVLPGTAPGYILTAILSKVFLHEVISPLRWAGTVFIVMGTWLVARTYSSPTPQPKGGTSTPEETWGRPLAEPVANTLEGGSN